MQSINGERLPTVTEDAILGFFGSYRFLSNFHQQTLLVDGVTYPSSEHAFMAQKSVDPMVRVHIASIPDPGAAKRFGRTVTLRPDWDNYRLVAMLQVLLAKFSDPDLSARLLDTGDKYLEETNYWGDRYWGVCDGSGSNFLGQTLMLVRSQRKLQTPTSAHQQDLF